MHTADDSHNLSALLPFVTPEILTLSLRSGLLSSISNLSRFPALHQLSRALPGGEEEMRPLLSDALRHLRCQEWEEWRGGLRARGCGPLVNCCRSCERWDVAMRQGVGLYNHTASCPALGLSMCHASADGKSVSFRQLHGSLPSGSSERDFEEGIAQLMQGCAASALGPASFFFPLSYGEGERELLMVRGLIPAGTYRYRFQQARERGELEASAITSYHDFLQAAFLPIQSVGKSSYLLWEVYGWSTRAELLHILQPPRERSFLLQLLLFTFLGFVVVTDDSTRILWSCSLLALADPPLGRRSARSTTTSSRAR